MLKSMKNKKWLPVAGFILAAYLIYNLLSLFVGVWENVIPISQLPYKIVYANYEFSLSDLSETDPNKRYDLYISNLDGSNSKNITSSVFPDERYLAFGKMRWSPDGRRVAFYRVIRHVSPDGKNQEYRYAIAVADQDGSNYRELFQINNIRKLWGYPRWSEDSRQILLEYYPKENPGPVFKVVSLDEPEVVKYQFGREEEENFTKLHRFQSFHVHNPYSANNYVVLAPDGFHRYRKVGIPGPIGGYIVGPYFQVGLRYAILYRTVHNIHLPIWLPTSHHYVGSYTSNIVVQDIRGNMVSFQARKFAIQGMPVDQVE